MNFISLENKKTNTHKKQAVSIKDDESVSSSKISVIQFEKNIFIMMISDPITDL